MRSTHVSVVIPLPAAEVYAYARRPENLSSWASGLASGEVTVGSDGVSLDSPMGRVRVEFCPENDLGILDHSVTLPDGSTVLNPMRVVAHPDGSEVLFTVRQLGMTEDELMRDAATVREDLERLRDLLS